MVGTRSVVVGLVALAMGLTACQAAPGVDQGELDGGPEDVALLAADLMGRTSDFQAAILKDGKVTQVENDRAVAAALSCMDTSDSTRV